MGAWTFPFTAYFMLLNARVVRLRLKNKSYLGDQTGEPTVDKGNDPLYVANRCQNNFVENVPLALLLAAIVELNGGDRTVLHSSLGALLLFRVLHVEFGFSGPGTMAHGRPIGFYGAAGFISGMAAYAAYLVKGYWGY